MLFKTFLFIHIYINHNHHKLICFSSPSHLCISNNIINIYCNFYQQSNLNPSNLFEAYKKYKQIKIKEYLKRREVCDFLPKKYVDLMRSIAINHEIDTFFFESQDSTYIRKDYTSWYFSCF